MQKFSSTLESRTAMIFGISNSAASQIAYTLAFQGFKVILVDNSRNNLCSLTHNLRNIGTKAYAYLTDISREEELPKIVSAIEKRFKKIDILINFSGQRGTSVFHTAGIEEIEKDIIQNLKIPIILTRLLISSMKLNGYGHIINVQLDEDYRTPLDSTSLYSTTKIGLNEFMDSIEKNYRSAGICASSIDARCFDDACLYDYGVPGTNILTKSEILANEVVKKIKTNDRAYLAYFES